MIQSVTINTAPVATAAADLIERQFPGNDEPPTQAMVEAAVAHIVAGRVLAQLVGADAFSIEALVGRVLDHVKNSKRRTSH